MTVERIRPHNAKMEFPNPHFEKETAQMNLDKAKDVASQAGEKAGEVYDAYMALIAAAPPCDRRRLRLRDRSRWSRRA
jgi:hypothetical protein